jgi:RNA polymerase sigma factor (sigma-70 family)
MQRNRAVITVAEGIIHQYEEELSLFIQSRISNHSDREDLLQEVWFQLSRKLEKEPLDNPRAWLYRVTRNKIIDYYRKKSPEGLEELFWDEEDDEYTYENQLVAEEGPEQLFFRDQFWEAFYEALDALPEKQRLVFVKHEMDGLTLREIADEEETNLKTIISRKGYAVRFLRNRLEWLWEAIVEVD